MNLSLNSMLNAQDDYFEKLEEFYQKEKQNKLQMKDYTISMCIKIQKFIKQKQLKKKTKAGVKIQLWWKKYYEKVKKRLITIQNAKLILATYRIFYFMQKIHKRNKVLNFTQADWKRIKSIKFSKNEIQKIQFLQIFFSCRYKMRRQYLKYLMKNVKIKLKAQKIINNQRQLSLKASTFYREQLMTNIAFENEIKFIDNTIAYNLITFQQKWDQYENKLTKFMKGRNKNENFIEQRNAFGESVWTNIKTMEQTQINPVEQNLQANIKKFKEQAENEFVQSNQYLDQAREELINSKSKYQKLSTDLFYNNLKRNL